ncbi:hypothetical protein [Singulisphaera sp. PoT]|uniref:hypothetical protein n=1 Tax=Singulisphaera sp. PoT TaxID=3411797 RepID=UPI003BF55551
MIEQTDQQPAFRETAAPGTGGRRDRHFIGRVKTRVPVWLVLALLLLADGCGIAPKGFKSLNNPAAITRARSVGLGNNLPNARVIPALIDRLSDTDPVVRLSAHEELKKRTGQDFGYVPWGELGERNQAVARWKQWWGDQKPALARNRQNP